MLSSGVFGREQGKAPPGFTLVRDQSSQTGCCRCCPFQARLQPTTRPPPPTAGTDLSNANRPRGSLFGPIRRPPNSTCEAPDSSGLMHVGDVSACTFVPLVIRRCWITECFTASGTLGHPTPTPTPTVVGHDPGPYCCICFSPFTAL